MKKIVANESRALIANSPGLFPAITKMASTINSPTNFNSYLYKTQGIAGSISKQAIGLCTSPPSMFERFNIQDNL